MSLDQWPAAFKAAGLSVQLHNGFPNTSKPQGSLSNPLMSLYVHHDATPAGPTPGALNWIIDSYNSGSPSAQLWLDTSGVWHFCGAGVASHAGVVRGGLTNRNSVGVETDHTVNELYPTPMMASLLKGCAVACKVEKRQADFITFHKIEASPRGRKQDPWLSKASDTQANWDKELADFRAKVQVIINTGGPATPDTTPEEKGFLMALSDAQQNDLFNKVDFLYKNEVISGQPFDKTAANFNDVRQLIDEFRKTAGQLNKLFVNETDGDFVNYPFTKTAANFNDVRNLIKKVDEVLVLLKGGTPEPEPVPETYTVVAGDTFTSIAGKLGVTLDALHAANPQVTDINNIAVGQVLNVPKSVEPVIDKRDRYRAQVDQAVDDFGDLRPTKWGPLPRARAKRICYRVVFTETDWRNLANQAVPESLAYPNDGYGQDKDSVGLYQQRARWWGTTQGSMDPYIATQRFLDEMLKVAPGWFTTDEAEVSQMVQRSQYDGITIDPKTGKPYPYAQNYRDRDTQTAAMERDPLYYTNGGR